MPSVVRFSKRPRGAYSGYFAEIGGYVAWNTGKSLISLVTPTGIEPVFQP
jgi:hypothetical protein